jgi:hypothetical protein
MSVLSCGRDERMLKPARVSSDGSCERFEEMFNRWRVPSGERPAKS